MGLFDELAETTRSVTERVAPSVVRIGRHAGRGCGVVIDDGLVLTNAHNLRGPETTVTLAGDRRVTGRMRAVDVDGDVAVLEVDTADAPAIAWSEGQVTLGDAVFTVARSPAGDHRVTFGLVSATERAFRGPRGRRITGTLEHTAPLARGSSGSPLVDLEGRLVGLNTNRLGDGFYLALPADEELRRQLDTLQAGQAPRRLRLGVGLAPQGVARRLRASVGLPERDGLLVRSVEPDSPADRAGVKQGDLIVALDDTVVADADDLYDALDSVGTTATLHLVRGADDLDVAVTFADA